MSIENGYVSIPHSSGVRLPTIRFFYRHIAPTEQGRDVFKRHGNFKKNLQYDLVFVAFNLTY